MEKEAIDQAIAEAVGFAALFSSDLNAMHEAEATLTGETNYYHQLLIRMNNYDGLATVRATAAQRAEAFLRTIGKWEEA